MGIQFPFDGNQQLKNMLDVLVIGETDSPSATSGLRYFSTLDS
jgi:hypothetical protein